MATERVEEEFALSIGGFLGGFEVDLRMLEEDDRWLGVGEAWPERTENRHLHAGFHPDIPAKELWGSEGPLQFGQSNILARRIRYRFGIDFAQKEKSQPADALFWWSTPQTELWIAKTHTKPTHVLDPWTKRDFNYRVNNWMKNLSGSSFPNIDPVTLSADDWGVISLTEDPIRLRYVGPISTKASTHFDVEKTLGKAGSQMVVQEQRCSTSETEFALKPIIKELEIIAGKQREEDFCDVVIAYRGGGLKEDTLELRRQFEARKKKDPRARLYGLTNDQTRRELVVAIEGLVALGVEVVLGIGHGDEGIYEKLRIDPPAGVHEAVTPTAAAAWVLREHINHRIVDSVVDLGQSG